MSCPSKSLALRAELSVEASATVAGDVSAMDGAADGAADGLAQTVESQSSNSKVGVSAVIFTKNAVRSQCGMPCSCITEHLKNMGRKG